MKIKIISASIIVIFITLLVSVSFAATGTVEFKSNINEVNAGETFTVTLSATSEEGINGINTKYVFDSEKLELISESIVDSTIWSNIGTSPDITIICNSTQKIKNADIYILKFKVKDNVSPGSKITIETNNIMLDTDAQTDSEVTISPRKIEMSIKEELKEYPDEKEKKTENETTTIPIDSTKRDTTYAKGILPKTGKNFVMISVLLLVFIILSILLYKKYLQHKDIN